jgi:cell surface protein SprA
LKPKQTTSLSFVRFALGAAIVISVLTGVWAEDRPLPVKTNVLPGEETFVPDSDTLRYPFNDRIADEQNSPPSHPLYGTDPANIHKEIEYDPKENQYNINERIGNMFYRNPSYMTFEEFRDQQFQKSTHDYWIQRASEEDALTKKTFAPKIFINSAAFDRIFGGNTIDIRPQGSAELTFKLVNNKNQDPALPERQRSVTTFDFKESIQMNVTANIGDKMKLATNYNTDATFEFENKMKLEYTGYEDDIIKKIEAGNVSLPLNGQLITGSQSLFGLKTELQFGRMKVTTVFSQQKAQSKHKQLQGGAQVNHFDIKGDQYEANRHFFLGRYFRDTYESNLYDINQIRSGVNITRVEVWVRNTGSVRQGESTRNIIALADLGERQFDQSVPGLHAAGFSQPADSANNLVRDIPSYSSLLGPNIDNMRDNIGAAPAILTGYGLVPGRNYVVQENARLLSSSEYSVNSLLGYISLSSELDPNKILAVAYEYTFNGKVFRVGELSTSGVTGSRALFVKLLRSTSIDPTFYVWDLMMKNVYNLGGYNLRDSAFRLDVLYQDDKLGGAINYIPYGCINRKPLIQVLGMDKINQNGDPPADGVFDFKDGITIDQRNGRVFFPVLEPFGSSLKAKFCIPPDDTSQVNKYIFQELYDTTRVIAQQHAEKNKYSLRGSYISSSGAEIQLDGVNIPQGSVTVTAGGTILNEGSDYTVDYTLGRVKIINSAYLNANTPIDAKYETQSLFNIQTKTMLGTRLDYYFNKDFTLGATFLHLSERPITQKVNVGDEPISNTIVGFDGTYRTDSRWLTKVLDKLPFYSTKETSSLTFSGEVAELFPGHSRAIGKNGIAYVDDFEGAITPLDIKSPGQWFLASTPQGQTDIFPEDAVGLVNGYNRSKLAWYYVDNIFQSSTSSTPDGITNDMMSNNYVREIQEPEIFPNKSTPNGPRSILCTNVAFYPAERGPYNYVVNDTSIGGHTIYGLASSGQLSNPDTRWGGIMRKVESTDFQNSNIEYLQFWLMDPFADDSPNSTGGTLYFNLGDISEDVLRDNHKSYENGINYPSQADNHNLPTVWGNYPDPNLPQIGYVFDNNSTNRQLEDIGIDGLNDIDEQNFYQSYLTQYNAVVTNQAARDSTRLDPSNDDYHYFQRNDYNSSGLGPLERYKMYNGMEGNSPTDPVDGFQALATRVPDNEDLNKDFTLNTEEQYFQYKIDLHPGSMVVGQNFITDMIESEVHNLPNNVTGRHIKWYQFKVPVKDPQKTIGYPSLTYINGIRMFVKDFSQPVILRFAKLEFLRGDWRKYDAQLLEPGVYEPVPTFPGNATFDLSYVSIEENSTRDPIHYVLPPGIEKERDISTTQNATLNEQSLVLKVCHLVDGEARAAYKTTQLDIRTYKKLKMFIHAESSDATAPLNNGDLTAFIRLGSDFTDNYYEYEIPLVITQPGDNGRDQVWPEANNLEITLDELVNAKTQRNNAQVANPAAVSLLTPYVITLSTGRRITIKGSPNLSNVRVLMLGLRNPRDPSGNGPEVCGEVWVNELRLSDFDEKGGWAALGRVQATLADLGSATLSGRHSTPGFGNLEEKQAERSKTDSSNYEISTNLELGKFLPEKTGIKIPFHYDFSEGFGNPQYNALDPDVIYKKSLENAPSDSARNAVERASQDYIMRKNISFTNVKKTKTGKGPKSHIYDVENLNFTYAYQLQYQRNINIEYTTARSHMGLVGYNYINTPKPVQPFNKSKKLSSPFLKLIKDFNFYYAPSSLSFSAQIKRDYAETQIRNNNDANFVIDPTFTKKFTMQRTYGLNYDFTKSLKFEFNAIADATIDEPYGKIDTQKERDSIWSNIRLLGRLTNYHHAGNLTYAVPLSKIPFLDWMTATAKYGGDYTWTTGRYTFDTLTNSTHINSFYHTIQNSQTWSINGNATLTTLYNKSKYLKSINQPAPPKPAPPKARIPKPAADSTQKVTALKDTTKKSQPSVLEPIFKNIFRLAMSVRTASITYTETNGTMLPGFVPRPDVLGQNFNFTRGGVSSDAPGWGFLSGSQKDIRPAVERNHWLTNDTTLNTMYETTRLQNLTGRIGAEPVKNFKIDITFNRNYTQSHSEYFRATSYGTDSTFNPIEGGNFSISYLTWNTAFVKDQSSYSNDNFEKFRTNRAAISALLARQNPNSSGVVDSGYVDGYGGTQSEVLTYAFLSAYSGRSPSNKIIDRFPKIPKPNWRITYDGLSKLKFTQKYLQSLTISHGYRSVYTVNSFTQDLLYDYNVETPHVRDTIGNFIPRYTFQQVTIAEQFAPLFGIDMTFKNSLQARFEVKRDRTLTLSYANIQVTEVRGNEYIAGLGYKIKKVKLPFVTTKKKITSDLNLKADFGMRKNYTILRKLVENANQPSAGNTTVTAKISADYNINERFNISVFANKTINTPFVSTSFPNSNFEAGFKVRFTLSQ